MNAEASKASLVRWSQRSGIVIMVSGGLIVVGWIAAAPVLRRAAPGFVPGDALTGAYCFLAGLALWRLAGRPKDWLGMTCAALIVLGGGMELCRALLGIDLNWHQWLSLDGAAAFASSAAAPNTACAFILCGLGLLLLDVETRRGFRPGQLCLLLAAFIALLALVGYAYRVPPLRGIGPGLPMSIASALLIEWSCGAALSARPRDGIMRVLTSDTTGGAMARRLLPAAILIPLVLGMLRLTSERRGYLEVEFGVSLFAVAIMVLFAGLIWWNARLLFRAEEERRRMERRSAVQYGVTRALAESADWPEARDKVLRAICAALNAAVGAWWTVDAQPPRIRCEYAWAASATATAFAEANRPTTFASGAGLPGRVWVSGEAACIRDVLEDEGFLRGAEAADAGLHGALAFAVRLDETICGVFEFFTDRSEEADDALLQTLTAVGRQIGQYIERRRAEEALRQAGASLARSNAELQQFAYIASHDLTEPLRMVVSYLQLLVEHTRGKLDAEAQEFVAHAIDGAQRLQGLIKDLLEYAKVDARGEAWGNVDVESVLAAAVANLGVTIEENQALIEHQPLPRVRADGPQLTRVFQNLIGNAIKFRGAAPPHIRIGAQRQDGEWVFRVQDNGIGIDPSHAERIFVLFQRLHTRREYPGTGMGLAICRKIIERHGGRIWVDSRPGQGAAFCFTLPARP